MANKKRTVYSCPVCGWESFNDDDYEAPCGQENCTGKLSAISTEDYEA